MTWEYLTFLILNSKNFLVKRDLELVKKSAMTVALQLKHKSLPKILTNAAQSKVACW